MFICLYVYMFLFYKRVDISILVWLYAMLVTLQSMIEEHESWLMRHST